MDKKQIKTQALFSAIWKFLERIIAQLVSLVVSIILARILMPEDYSVVSLVAIFFTFANILISGGFNSALIQKKNADETDYSTVLFLCVIFSLVIYALIFFAAPFLALLYKQPLLIPIFRVMGLTLPINAVKSIWCAYISAHLQFKKFFFATIGGTLISAVVGISMAVTGFGPWALVAQQMTNAVIDTSILMFTTRIGFRFVFSFLKFKELFSFGWKVLVSSFIGTVYSQIVPLVIGVKYTSADLAYYTKGKSFPELLSTTTTNTLAAVLFPVLSKFQDSKESLHNYTRLYIRLSSYVAFPLMLGLFAVADSFVSVLLTDKWLFAVPYIKIFCVANMFEMVHIGNCETIKAMGRSDVYLVMEIIKKTAYFVTIGLFLLFSKSPVMLATAFIICTLIALIVNSQPNRKLIGYGIMEQISDILPNFTLAVIMCLTVTLAGKIEMNKVALLFFQVMVGVIVYLILSLITHNKSFNYIIGLVKELRHK